MDCLRKLQVLTSYLGQMRDTINETRESLLAETLNLNTHVRYDSKHFCFYVGFESHRCSNISQWCKGSTPSSGSRRFQAIVHMGRLDGVRNNGGSSILPWMTNGYKGLYEESRE